MSKGYGHGMTNRDIAESKTAQMEDSNRDRIRQLRGVGNHNDAIREEIAARREAEARKMHPSDRDSALAAFDKRNPDIIGHPGAKIRAFQGYEELKDRASRGDSFDWHIELTKMEQSIRQDVGWVKDEAKQHAEEISELKTSRGQQD